MLPYDFLLSSVLDIEEVYLDISESRGRLTANFWYYGQLCLAFPAFLNKAFYWSALMIRNYFRLAFRSFLKHKISSVVNIVGLSTAIGCAVVMFAFINLQLNMDHFHEHGRNIFLVEHVIQTADQEQTWGNTPVPLGPALKRDFPQVIASVRLADRAGAMRYKEQVFNERIRFADPEFFDVFTFPLKYGDTNALHDRSTIILSEASALKYFGRQNPVGETVTVTFENDRVESFEIRGVAEKFPPTASFQFEILANYDKQLDLGRDLGNWADLTEATFIRVDNADLISRVESQMGRYLEIQRGVQPDRPIQQFVFDPLFEVPTRGMLIRGTILAIIHPVTAWSCGILALAILALACFNYLNIAVVSASRRMKEIGIRKVVGSSKGQIIGQFLGENVVISLISLVLGAALAETVFLPGLSRMSGTVGFFEIEYAGNVDLWIFFFVLLCLTGLGAGLYPAFYISRFQPTRILRGFQDARKKSRLTHAILTFQFLVSFVLLTIGIAMIQDNSYLRDRDWGYTPAQTLVVPTVSFDQYQVLRNNAEQLPGPVEMAGSIDHIGRTGHRTIVEYAERSFDVLQFDVEWNYPEVMKLRLKEGRLFDKVHDSNSEHVVVVNETFVETLVWSTTRSNSSSWMGKQIKIQGTAFQVIGIVEDFRHLPFIDPIEPMMLRPALNDDFRHLILRVSPGTRDQTSDYLKATWKRYFPDIPYEGYSQDSIFDEYFIGMERGAKMLTYISIVALIISLMGLFGLVPLTITQRLKEISIRKVLGAGIPSIIRLINHKLVFVLTVSVMIGAGLSYLTLDTMFRSLSMYSQPVGVTPFLISAGLILGLSFGISIAWIYRGTSTNPVDVLRDV